MRRFVLFALLVMAISVRESESQKESWRDSYQRQGNRWDSEEAAAPTARAPRARNPSQQGRTLNRPTTKPSYRNLDEMTEGGACGVDAYTSHRVFGGDVSDIKQHPWLVQIELHDRERGIAIRNCGGFLINHRYVLSAGHCFVDKSTDKSLQPVNVILGEYDQTHEGPDCVINEERGEECTDGAVTVPIDYYTVHPNYRSSLYDLLNDITIVRMKRTVEYTKFIRPICLPTSDITASPPADLRFTVAGWGSTENSPSSSVKRQVEVPYSNTEECKKLFPFKTEGHMCAGGETGKDSCKGDSGGPLMYNRGGVYTAVGIVSTGDADAGCGNATALYTKIYNYLPWINDNIKP